MLCADLRRPPPPEQVKKFGAADKRSLVINECLQGVRTVSAHLYLLPPRPRPCDCVCPL